MRILVVGKFYTEGFAQHIAETLLKMGHSVMRYEPGLSYSTTTNGAFRLINKVKGSIYELYTKTPRYHKKTRNVLSELTGSEKIDLTLVCHDFLTPRQVEAIKVNTLAPVVLWFPDAISNFRNAMFLNADYDYLFFKEPFAIKILRNELGKNTFYLPECCNPDYHRPIEVTAADLNRYGCDLTTAGNLHPARVAFFSQLTEYDIKIWGLPAPHWVDTRKIHTMIQNHFVGNEEKSKSFACSKIVINSLHPTEIIGTNVRTFEVAASGSFQLVSWRPGLKQLYTEGQEVVSFENVADLKEKINYYLANPEERHRIARNAEKRTHAEHTYQERLDLMLGTIFKGKQGYILENNYCL